MNWLYFCAENSNNVGGAWCVLVATRHNTGVSRGNMSTCLSPRPADWLLASSNSKAIISQFIPLSASEQDTWGTLQL